MSRSVEQYLQAATRANTQRSYESAVRHFEVEWGGLLPASIDAIARYLADHATTLTLNTLKHRLAALSRWHQDHGFPDPTKAATIRQLLKGIRTLHPAPEKRAKPLELELMQRVCDWLTEAAIVANSRGNAGEVLRHTRDRALLLLGFWRGFRSDELVNLSIEFIEIDSGEGMTLFIPRSKTDRQLAGRRFTCPALSRLCPVEAVETWLALSDLKQGPLFRKIDRWGHLSASGLAPSSIIPLIRQLLADAGIADAGEFSSHSLRRGFAQWAHLSGWDLRELMNYVGWRDIKTAMRYLDGADSSLKSRFEQGLAQNVAKLSEPAQRLALTLPSNRPTVFASIEISLQLSPFSGSSTRKTAAALRDITQTCLARFQAQQIDESGRQYRITVPVESADELDEQLYALLDELHQIADAHECFLDATCRNPEDGKHWD